MLALLVALFAGGTCLAASLHSAVVRRRPSSLLGIQTNGLARQGPLPLQGIPHYIHQSWKNHSIPAEFTTMTETWRKLHPSWHYR